MSTLRIARRYAKALMGTVESIDQAHTIVGDLNLVVAAQLASSDFRAMMKSPVIQASKKKAIIDEMFGSQVTPLTLEFISLLADKGREGDVATIAREFGALLDIRRQQVRVTITSAVELATDVQQSTVAALSKILGQTVIPTWNVDPSILGGLSIRMGDKVIDSSLRGNLRRLRSALASGSAPSTN